MTSTELKQYLYENKKIPDILQDLGCAHIQYHSKGYWSCSNVDGDNPTAVNIDNTQYLTYINWTRGISGSDHEDLIDFVEYVKGCDFIEAVRYLHRLFNIPFTYRNKGPIVKKENPLTVFTKYLHRSYFDVENIKVLSESNLSQFAPLEHVSFYKEGIMPYSAVKKFGLCYDYSHHRQVIPVRSALTGELLGFNARSTIPNCQELGIPKYFLTPGMPKQLTLYGLWENKDYIKSADKIVVFEAEKSVLKRDSLMDHACVALEGHVISEEQVRILIGCCKKEIVIAMDKDVSEREVFAICDKFYGIRQVSYIQDKWGIIGDKDAPCDKGNKIYQFLLKHRFPYGEAEHKKYISMK